MPGHHKRSLDDVSCIKQTGQITETVTDDPDEFSARVDPLSCFQDLLYLGRIGDENHGSGIRMAPQCRYHFGIVFFSQVRFQHSRLRNTNVKFFHQLQNSLHYRKTITSVRIENWYVVPSEMAYQGYDSFCLVHVRWYHSQKVIRLLLTQSIWRWCSTNLRHLQFFKPLKVTQKQNSKQFFHILGVKACRFHTQTIRF